jgi:hypothetical protein
VFFHCYLGNIRTMDKVRKPNISVCYTPSSEPYSIYFSVCCFFTSRFLVTASNSGDSSASALTLLLSGEYPTALCTELNYKLIPLITPQHGPTENTALLLLLQTFPLERVCLRRR